MRTVVTLTVAALQALPTLGADTPEPVVELRWALGALDTAQSQPTAISRDTELASGARLKLPVEPKTTTIEH